VEAGSEIVLTNTLNAHEGNYPANRVVALNTAATRLARQSGARWVAGSMGPGAGEVQARALLQAGIALFWIETQLDLAQAQRTIAACQRVSDTPIVVAFSFHREDGLTQSGESAAEVASAMTAHGACAVGLNCGVGLQGATERLAEMAAATHLPLVFKPNVGLPRLSAHGWVYELGAGAWAAGVGKRLTERVQIVGGCCGTTPAHIAALRARINGNSR
jgi:5-methyltetrahydrofolate--homocysteine methyltransferase